MKRIKLQAEPNQQITAYLDGAVWAITLKACGGGVAVSISRDGELLIAGQRAVPGEPLIPYRHMAIHGNFAIDTATEGAVFDCQEFGRTQNLYFASPDEINE